MLSIVILIYQIIMVVMICPSQVYEMSMLFVMVYGESGLDSRALKMTTTSKEFMETNNHHH